LILISLCKTPTFAGASRPKWADDTKRDAVGIRNEIGEILPANASAAFGGLAGEKFVNVLRSQLGTLQTLRILEIGFK
jgi:hypothetical protein